MPFAKALELQALLDAAVDSIVLIDDRGRIETVNSSAERMFGFRESELVGSNVSILMAEPDRSAHDAYMGRYLSTGIPHIIGVGREVTARRRDGSSFPVTIAVGRIPASDPPRFVGFLHDITLRREALAAVQRERDRANQYLEIAEVILLALDSSGRIALINRKGSEILGTDERELIGRDWLDLVHVEDRRIAVAAIEAGLAAKADAVAGGCEYRVISGGAEARLIAWRAVALRDSAARITGLLCSGDDVTERRRAEEASRQAEARMTHVSRLATLGEMAAGISHEINQPLTAIANYATACERLVAAPDPDVPEIQEALRQIAGQALRAGEIIRRLRNMARKSDAVRESVGVNEVVEEACTLAMNEARLHDVRLTLDLTLGLPPIEIDKIQIQQVILNLIRNSMEALEDRQDLRRDVIVRTAPAARSEIEIAVCDFGPGVDPGVADRIFHPFLTTKKEGTGLGLAISRSIVEAHDGTLGYRPHLPVGACFFMNLPLGVEHVR